MINAEQAKLMSQHANHKKLEMVNCFGTAEARSYENKIKFAAQDGDTQIKVSAIMSDQTRAYLRSIGYSLREAGNDMIISWD